MIKRAYCYRGVVKRTVNEDTTSLDARAIHKVNVHGACQDSPTILAEEGRATILQTGHISSDSLPMFFSYLIMAPSNPTNVQSRFILGLLAMR